MPSIADNLLAAGSARSIESVHGEQVLVLDGPDAGKTFVGVREVEQDLVMESIGADARARVVLRFISGKVPAILSTGRVQTDDGRVWLATRRQEAGYLTTDFELIERTTKDK